MAKKINIRTKEQERQDINTYKACIFGLLSAFKEIKSKTAPDGAVVGVVLMALGCYIAMELGIRDAKFAMHTIMMMLKETLAEAPDLDLEPLIEQYKKFHEDERD